MNAEQARRGREETINAVAAALARHLTAVYGYSEVDPLRAARVLADGGWLKDPADWVLTPTDQAVLDAADEWLAGCDAPRYPGEEFEVEDVLAATVRARRAAVGGSVPADSKEQP